MDSSNKTIGEEGASAGWVAQAVHVDQLLGGAGEGESPNVGGDVVDEGVGDSDGARVSVHQTLVIGLHHMTQASANAACRHRTQKQGLMKTTGMVVGKHTHEAYLQCLRHPLSHPMAKTAHNQLMPHKEWCCCQPQHMTHDTWAATPQHRLPGM